MKVISRTIVFKVSAKVVGPSKDVTQITLLGHGHAYPVRTVRHLSVAGVGDRTWPRGSR
jgi:hypothetical protein